MAKVGGLKQLEVILEGAYVIFAGEMGLQIFIPEHGLMVVKPFPKKASIRTVQFWCDVNSNSCNISVGKSIELTEPLKQFVIEFTRDEFAVISKMGSESLQVFAKSALLKPALLYSQMDVAMDAEMLRSIYRISNTAFSEKSRDMRVFAIVLELLVLFQMNAAKDQTSERTYIKSDYDKERIIYARDYLITHMDAPPSLQQLAAIAGINEFKLKCGFKELFHQSPYAYLADVRLEMARAAIQRKEKSISQLAFELGYASLPHFSGAFKKKFGVSPGKFG